MMSSPAAKTGPRLEIRKDIHAGEGCLFAESEEPWLLLVDERLCGKHSRFIELTYRIDAIEPPVRPILRVWFGPDHWRDAIMPAPTDGCGVWIGRLPRGWTEIWISPTNRPGETSFTIVGLQIRCLAAVATRLLRNPKRLFFAMSAELIGLGEEAALNWRWALGSESKSAYAAWRASRRLTRETGGRKESPFYCDVFLNVGDASASEIDESCGSIERQTQDQWRVSFVGSPADSAAGERLSAWARKPQFRQYQDSDRIAPSALVCHLHAGDRLEAEALELVAACFKRHAEMKIAYSDESQTDASGRPTRLWRPGWSPTLQRSLDYVGRAFFFRAALLEHVKDWLDRPGLFDLLASRLERHEVGSIARPLFVFPAAPAPIARPFPAIHVCSAPSVAIVIPTRDRADLLAECLDSLFRNTTYQNYEVTLVDNDSREPRTHALIARMQREQSRLSVLSYPGAFNFSALSNAGAAASRAEYLLFLNNDTQIVTPDWIERLLYFAMQADVGAVGAKLLFPDRTVQHVGVVLGMGGVAGHFGAGLKESDGGWLGRNLLPHEVSAVSGACLMVAREKFQAAGKFDADNLPVDLNDVDLCLRLLQLGLRNICQSQTVLIHHQSASRGGGLRLQRVYARERRYFVERWRSLIRDDPWFNPGLSLYAQEEMLP